LENKLQTISSIEWFSVDLHIHFLIFVPLFFWGESRGQQHYGHRNTSRSRAI